MLVLDAKSALVGVRPVPVAAANVQVAENVIDLGNPGASPGATPAAAAAAVGPKRRRHHRMIMARPPPEFMDLVGIRPGPCPTSNARTITDAASAAVPFSKKPGHAVAMVMALVGLRSAPAPNRSQLQLLWFVIVQCSGLVEWDGQWRR